MASVSEFVAPALLGTPSYKLNDSSVGTVVEGLKGLGFSLGLGCHLVLTSLVVCADPHLPPAC